MAEGGYKIDSTTAHSDTTSISQGGNAGVTFGGGGLDQTTLLIIGALALAALLFFRGR